jgi:hypothetical protein
MRDEQVLLLALALSNCDARIVRNEIQRRS